jgi:SAM-dependent methyltransferase
MIENKTWSNKLIHKLDPSFEHRWEKYENLLNSLLDQDTVWVDMGCGKNEEVAEKANRVKFALGIDVDRSDIITSDRFLIADIDLLPIKDNSVDIVSLRFVAEHLKNPTISFKEINRILRPGGKVILITTNLWSPFVFIPKIIPYKFRKILIYKLFKVQDNDVFPTYHRINTKITLSRSLSNFKLEKFFYIQDVNISRKPLFLIFFFWHLITKCKILRFMRSNIIAVIKKME